jgi:hypothetical protein
MLETRKPLVFGGADSGELSVYENLVTRGAVDLKIAAAGLRLRHDRDRE